MFAQIGRALDSVMQMLGHFVFVLALWAFVNAVIPFDESKISPEMIARIQFIGTAIATQFKRTAMAGNAMFWHAAVFWVHSSALFMELVNLYIAGIWTGFYAMGMPVSSFLDSYLRLNMTIDSCWRSNTTYCFPLANSSDMMTMLRG